MCGRARLPCAGSRSAPVCKAGHKCACDQPLFRAPLSAHAERAPGRGWWGARWGTSWRVPPAPASDASRRRGPRSSVSTAVVETASLAQAAGLSLGGRSTGELPSGPVTQGRRRHAQPAPTGSLDARAPLLQFESGPRGPGGRGRRGGQRSPRRSPASCRYAGPETRRTTHGATRRPTESGSWPRNRKTPT